jgi:pimeloyl-ACP methyl ester carboxylesterase
VNRTRIVLALTSCSAVLALCGCSINYGVDFVNGSADVASVEEWLEERPAPLRWDGVCEEDLVSESMLESLTETNLGDRTVPSMQCGTLSVPLDWANVGASEALEVSVVRTSLGEQKPDVIVVNPGGPGASARKLAVALAMRSEPQKMLEQYDFVGLEPRGLPGAATARNSLECDSEDIYACASNNPLAAHASTTDVAMDHELLRRALQQDKLNYLGYSYGSYLGTVYATLFPDNVGRMVLDGIADPELLAGDEQSTAIEDVVATMMNACVEGEFGVCPLGETLEEAESGFQRVVDDLDATPATVTNSAGASTKIDGRRALSYLAGTLTKSRSTWAESISAFAGAGTRSPEALATIANSESPEQLPMFSGAIKCAVEAARKSDTLDVDCGRWPVIDRLDPHAKYEGRNPILLVAASHDPATPIAGAKRAHKSLKNSILIEVDAYGHGLVYKQSTCAQELVENYFLNGVAPASDVRCAEGS